MKGVGALVLLLLGPLVLVSASGRSEQPTPGLVNNMIQHTMAAPDFTLTDQHGQPFHLADARGKVVVLCFIYTHLHRYLPVHLCEGTGYIPTTWR